VPHNNATITMQVSDSSTEGSVPLAHIAIDTATHSNRCLEVFHCSSAVSGW